MIGLDVSDKSIKIVQFANSKDRKLLTRCALHLPDGVMNNGLVEHQKGLQEALTKAFAMCKLTGKIKDQIVASIPETQSFLRVVEIPDIKDNEVGEAVQWEVAQHIPFGIENVYIDWQPIRSEGHKASQGHREVQVGAAQRKVVDGLYEAMNAIGLDVAAFELESQAIIRALISPELKRKQGLLVVDLGGSATNVIVHDHGAMRFTATLQRGIEKMAQSAPPEFREIAQSPEKMDAGQAERLSEALRPGMEELVAEIKGVADFYNSIDDQHEIREIILTGGGSNVPGFSQVFPKYFDSIHVQRGNPWATIFSHTRSVTPPMGIEESVRFVTALGLALRPVLF